MRKSKKSNIIEVSKKKREYFMKIKTTELTGAALDWAVCKADNNIPTIVDGSIRMTPWHKTIYSPSTDWSQGMPILDIAGICVRAIRKSGHDLDGTYLAMEARRFGTGTNTSWHEVCWPEAKLGSNKAPRIRWSGDTHLVAGLRCFVGIVLGEEVEVPDEVAV